MSFGIKLEDKDLVFDGAGKVAIVVNEEKLIQGLDKILRTEQGRNFLHQLYGSTLYNLIGGKLSSALMTSLLSKNMSGALDYFINIQQNQRLVQYVSPREIIASVESVIVDRLEARAVSVRVVIRTLQGSQAVALTNIQEV